MPKFRKKPVEIEARQWEGGPEAATSIINWILESGQYATANWRPVGTTDGIIRIPTLEGVMEAHPGDWIIKGVNGEFYPCKPYIFEKTYESVEAFPDAICNTCGKPKNTRFIGHWCNEDCTGMIIANPRLEKQD